MSRKQWIVIVSLCLILVAVGVIYMRHSTHPNGNTVVIGAVLSLTGDTGEYGQRIQRGMDIAVEELNNSTPGRYKILYEDDEGIPLNGVAAADKLQSISGVRYIIGAVSSTVTLSIVPIAQRSGFLLFSPAASSPNLSGASPYFVRDWPSDVLEGTVFGQYAANQLGLRTVAILYVNNDYGLGLKGEFSRAFSSLGRTIVATEGYPLNTRDFRPLLGKYRNQFNNIQAFYLAGYSKDMAFATKQLREAGYRGLVLGDADYGTPETLAIAGDAAEGAVYASPWYDPESNETARKFALRFKQQFGGTPSEFEANGYDAVMLIDNAIRSGHSDPRSMAAYIRTVTHYAGAGGYLTFTAEGDVIKPIAIMKVQQKAFMRLDVVEERLGAGGS